MSTENTTPDGATSPTTRRAELANGEQGHTQDRDGINGVSNAPAAHQATRQPAPLLSADELAELDRFFDALDDFVAIVTAFVPLSAGQTAIVRQSFESESAVRARARATASRPGDERNGGGFESVE